MKINITIERLIIMANKSTDDLINQVLANQAANQAAILAAIGGIQLSATDLTPVLTAIANGNQTVDQGIAAINALIAPSAPTSALPAVSSISPTAGPVAGGTVVTVTGTGFTGATAVNFGTIPGAALTVASDTSLTVTSPALPAGTADVTVVTPAGTSATSAADQFTAS